MDAYSNKISILLSNRKEFVLKVLILFSVVIISIFRQPELLYQPRFFAEEGASYFSYAFCHSWLDNLLHPQYGYNTLYNSLATSFAAMFPLEIAPLITTYLALMVQILASCAVLFADIPGLDSFFKRFVVAIAIPILSYARVWLNTLGVQYLLCVVAFLVLMENHIPRQRLAISMRGLLLLFAGLSGVVTCFMTPAFLYKAIQAKSRQFAIYSVILIVCSVIQIGVFLKFILINNTQLTNRFVHHDIGTWIGILVKFIKFHFYAPFFGIGNLLDSTRIEVVIRSAIPYLDKYEYELAPAFIGMIVMVLFGALLHIKYKSLDTKIFLITYVLITTLSTILSINMSGGPRYAFVPNCMLVIFFVSCLNDNKIKAYLRYLVILLVCSMVIINGIEYRLVMNSFAYDDNWPMWSEEVGKWRQNSNYPLKIWPPPWQMVLEKK